MLSMWMAKNGHGVGVVMVRVLLVPWWLQAKPWEICQSRRICLHCGSSIECHVMLKTTMIFPSRHPTPTCIMLVPFCSTNCNKDGSLPVYFLHSRRNLLLTNKRGKAKFACTIKWRSECAEWGQAPQGKANKVASMANPLTRLLFGSNVAVEVVVATLLWVVATLLWNVFMSSWKWYQRNMFRYKCMHCRSQHKNQMAKNQSNSSIWSMQAHQNQENSPVQQRQTIKTCLGNQKGPGSLNCHACNDLSNMPIHDSLPLNLWERKEMQSNHWRLRHILSTRLVMVQWLQTEEQDKASL